MITYLHLLTYLLHTDRWVLRHQQATNRGQLMIWGIDEESRVALEAVNFQPHFGLGCVTFRVARPVWK